jgi:hypothetical protein
MKVSHLLGIAAIAVLAGASLAGAQTLPRLKPLPPHKSLPAHTFALAAKSSSSWQALTNQPPLLDYADCGTGNPLLLTDGTVMIQDAGCQDWWKLTPDSSGSYMNGTWTQLASLPSGYSPLYHSSAVLPDGRVIIMGGEYNFLVPDWTNQGAIYDPVADTWTSVAPPSGWTTIGDAQSVVMANGTFMQANCCTTQSALLNPKTLTWTPTGGNKYDPNDEEGWTLLPNQQVLTVDAYVPISPFPYIPTGTNSEIYNPRTGQWHSAGSTIVQLWDSWEGCGANENSATFEVGPAVLRPDGTVFYTGSNTCGPGQPGHTAIYNSYAGKWKAGPNFPDSLNIADGPAALEPNGKVLMMASPGYGDTPSTFLEWDGKNLTEVPPSPNAAIDGSYYGNMLVLPTGQIPLTDFYSVAVYTPSGSYDPLLRPIVGFAPETVSPGKSYEIVGLLFNGWSQGAAYGDDVQAATNYPLVRITNNATGHVFYSRTHDHSSMGVVVPNLVSTHFDVPANEEKGLSKLEVVTNGIASIPVFVDVR